MNRNPYCRQGSAWKRAYRHQDKFADTGRVTRSMNPSSNVAAGSSTRGNFYHIEKVSTKRRALDVMVFEGLGRPSNEFILDHNGTSNERNDRRRNNETNVVFLEDKDVDLLMQDYDEHGRQIQLQPKQCRYGQEIYFAAICNQYRIDVQRSRKRSEIEGIDTENIERTNGVVGVVSAQLRQRSPLIAGSSIGDNNHTNPAVQIPFVHIYLSNMKVCESLQRKGIGTGLLAAVVEYSRELSSGQRDNIPIVLSVDTDNAGAVNLYENFGFEYMEKNDMFSIMIYQS